MFISENNSQLAFALVHVTQNVQLTATTLGYKLVSSLFWYGANLLSSDNWNKNWKNHKHILSTSSAAEFGKFSRNTRPKTADFHSAGKKSECSSISLGIRWEFNSRPGHFCRGPELAGLECSGCSGDRSEEWVGPCSTFKNIGSCNFISTKFRTQPKNWKWQQH